MVYYLKVGIVAVLACSLSSCLSIAEKSAMPLDPIERTKLEIAAACVREFLNSMEAFPDLYVGVYRTSMDRRSKVELEEELIRILGKERVYAWDSGKDQGLGVGVSVMAINLERVKIIENGSFHFEISEHFNFSEKYLHEFRISSKEGEIESVELLFSTEL